MPEINILPPTGSSRPSITSTLENPNVPIYHNTNSPEPTFGSDVDVREISLLLNSGLKIDLRGYVEAVIVNESMFNMKINGSVIVNDMVGALEKFQITGGEQLNLKIYKPKSENLLIWREDLIINKIQKHEVDPMNGYAKYQMIFTSNSFVRSIKKRIFKSYKNIPLINAIKNIYSEMSSNDLMYEDPQITLTEPYICTGNNPHDAIDFLAQRASSPQKYFVFYERFVPVTGQYIDGNSFAGSHYFGSVENLINSTSETGIETLVFGPKTNANSESGNTIRVSKFIKDTNFNQLESVYLGLNKTEFTYLDLQNRTNTTKKISYSDADFFSNTSEDFYNNSFMTESNRFRVETQEPGMKKISTTKRFGNKNKSDWLPYNIFGMLTKNYFKIGAIIQGGTNNISVGSIVQFNVISYFEKIANASSGTPPLDEMYSGKYYVTGVTHVITQDKYQKTLELSRGSSRIALNENASDFLYDKIKTARPDLAKLVIGR